MSTIHEVRVSPGDVVEVSGRRVGDRARSGEILEVLGNGDHPHYLVRWEDGHESILYPGEATTIRRTSARRTATRATTDLAAATTALVELLRDEEVEFELLPHRRTLRAAAEARVLGVLPQTVAKTLVVRDEQGRCVRAVVAATRRLSVERLATALAAKSVRLLTEGELVNAYPQFELGAVPPFGGPAGDLVVVDRELTRGEHVVVEAGVHDTSLRLRTEELVRVANAQVAEIATA
ncbi:MAG TPA: YbaK/EbsC family protein [Gaiellaceae bacterium]|nr:YbaK/EbsC family protein [Gaiellaceae bacterium]